MIPRDRWDDFDKHRGAPDDSPRTLQRYRVEGKSGATELAASAFRPATDGGLVFAGARGEDVAIIAGGEWLAVYSDTLAPGDAPSPKPQPVRRYRIVSPAGDVCLCASGHKVLRDGALRLIGAHGETAVVFAPGGWCGLFVEGDA